MYGVYPGSSYYGIYYCFNLKITSAGSGQLPKDDPITITYNKVKRTVQFKSSKFDLYQENLPEGVDFCLACSFWGLTAAIELEILNIDDDQVEEEDPTSRLFSSHSTLEACLSLGSGSGWQMVRWVKQLAQSSYDIHHSPTPVTSWPCSSPSSARASLCYDQFSDTHNYFFCFSPN